MARRLTAPPNGRRSAGADSELYAWDEFSTYIQEPPYFAGLTLTPAPIKPIVNARVLGLFGDSITTDHISPAGDIALDQPAGKWLEDHDVAKEDFNQYGARRGNDKIMTRGTFANIRLKNSAGARCRGRRARKYHDERRSHADLRRGDEIQSRWRAADRAGRQRIWHRLVARLGGQGQQCCLACAR